MEGMGVFPVPNSTLSYWRSELHEIDNIRTTKDLPKECDVLIIGAGLSGVSTAYHLLDDNPNTPSIVILEAREVCSGATGRNGGHLPMLNTTYIDRVIKSHGVEAAREFSLFRKNLLYAMKRVVEKEKLDCDAVLTRYIETTLSQSQMDSFTETYQEQLNAGLDFIDDVGFVGPKYAEQLSGVKGSKGGLTTTVLQMWPYKFVTGLLAKLIERTSINVQAHTRVTSITTENDYSLATTPRGTVRARQVVFASNAYTSGILSKYDKKIVPWKGTCSHISTPKDSPSPPPHLTQTYGLNFGPPGIRDYLIPRPDGGIICGGAKGIFVEDSTIYFNNFDDSTLIEPARAHFNTVMQNNFRGWEKSGAAVDYLWTGIMGATADDWPHCGRVPGQDNHFILAGFCGSGMGHIFLTAKGIAMMMRENVPFEESGIPRVFKTTEERLKKDVEKP